MKMLCSLVVQQHILLLPDGARLLCFTILWALYRYLTSPISLIFGKQDDVLVYSNHLLFLVRYRRGDS